MVILKIYLEKKLLIKYYAIKHLILLRLQNMMEVSPDLHQWFISFWIKSLLLTKEQELTLKTNN